MKNYFQPILTAVLCSLFLFSSCSKNSAGVDNSSTAAKDSIATSVTAGNFIISSFLQRSEDKTSQFKDFVFTFSAGGTLTATANGTTINGTWSYTPAVTYYGATSKAAFIISLGNSSPLSMLTKTWNIASMDGSYLKFDSPELAEDEHVQFSKQ